VDEHRSHDAPPLPAIQDSSCVIRAPEHQLFRSGAQRAYTVHHHRQKHSAVNPHQHVRRRCRSPERPPPSHHRLRSRNVSLSRAKNFRLNIVLTVEGPWPLRGWRNTAHIITLLHLRASGYVAQPPAQPVQIAAQIPPAFPCSLFFGLRTLRPLGAPILSAKDRQGAEL
jgi:hypothetical protein